MKLTKEECESAFKKIEKHFEENELIEAYEDELGAIYFALEQHFDNPPLKWEELKEGMWVWDNKEKMYGKVTHKLYQPYGLLIIPGLQWGTFEENRFFRREVKENEN